jgi:thiol-disulfide isomerase/thioredoxin
VRRSRRTIPFALVGLLSLLLVACGGSSTSSNSNAAAAVEFSAADGSTTSLDQMKGTPLVVNMWATWCKPCVKEMPAFDEVASAISKVRIMGVNVADSAEDAAAFATKLGVHYEQFTDPTGGLSDAFGVSGLPATAFIDAAGKVVEVHSGALTAAELTELVSKYFPQESTAP